MSIKTPQAFIEVVLTTFVIDHSPYKKKARATCRTDLVYRANDHPRLSLLAVPWKPKRGRWFKMFGLKKFIHC